MNIKILSFYIDYYCFVNKSLTLIKDTTTESEENFCSCMDIRIKHYSSLNVVILIYNIYVHKYTYITSLPWICHTIWGCLRVSASFLRIDDVGKIFVTLFLALFGATPPAPLENPPSTCITGFLAVSCLFLLCVFCLPLPFGPSFVLLYAFAAVAVSTTQPPE